jgi:pilus assembly protein CpaC
MKTNDCSLYTNPIQLCVEIAAICLGVVVCTTTVAQTTLPASKYVGSNIQIISEQPPNTNSRTATQERRITMQTDLRTGVVNRPSLPIGLYAGQVLVIDQPGVERVAIGNGTLLSATVVSDKQIVLLGEGFGITTLYVWLRNGNQINYEVSITQDNQSKTSTELRRIIISEPGIKVEAVGNRVVVDGVYANQESADRIKKIAAAYPQVLNLVRERPEDNIVIPDQMIQLDVKVIEVRKQALDEIGIKWSNLGISGPTFATSGYLYADTANFRGTDSLRAPVTNPARPFISYLGLATQITSALNFLESNGDSWTLAEPRISAVSGGESKIKIGGEIPIPVSSALGQINVVYKQYGVILEFKPFIDKSGNVRSKIIAEVSQPDRSNGNGQFVAFTNNRTETEVSLKQNETLVISGLLRNSGAKNKEGIPSIGNIPVVGRLFSNQGASNEQLETLVIVTPRLHKPVLDSNELLSNQNAYSRLNAVKSAVEEKLAR